MSNKDGYRNVMVSKETWEELSTLIAQFKKDHPVYLGRVSRPMLIGALVHEACINGIEVGSDKVGPVDGG